MDTPRYQNRDGINVKLGDEGSDEILGTRGANGKERRGGKVYLQVRNAWLWLGFQRGTVFEKASFGTHKMFQFFERCPDLLSLEQFASLDQTMDRRGVHGPNDGHCCVKVAHISKQLRITREVRSGSSMDRVQTEMSLSCSNILPWQC